MTLEEARERYSRPPVHPSARRRSAEAREERGRPKSHGEWRPAKRYTRISKSAGMTLDARLLFGRHLGKLISEISVEDPSYLRWIKSEGLGAEDDYWRAVVDYFEIRGAWAKPGAVDVGEPSAEDDLDKFPGYPEDDEDD